MDSVDSVVVVAGAAGGSEGAGGAGDSAGASPGTGPMRDAREPAGSDMMVGLWEFWGIGGLGGGGEVRSDVTVDAGLYNLASCSQLKFSE